MRVELIQPALAKFQEKRPQKWVAPPLGLAMVAAISPDVEFSITDESTEPVDFEKDIDLVGIRIDTPTAPHAYQIAAAFRARGVKAVLGGPHPSLCPEEASQHADAIIMGEAEGLWEQLLRDLQGNRLEPIYHHSERPSLTGLPLPRRDLFDNSRYLFPNIVLATRGCPYSCSFCSISAIWGQGFRTRPIDDVLNEIETLNGRMFFFADDNLIGNPKYAKELFRALTPYKKKWGCQASIDVANDEELLKLAAESGCVAMTIGFESICPANLAYTNKRINVVEEYHEAISIIHSYGIAIHGSFIIGLDEDDSQVFQRTLRFAQDTELETAWFAPLTPYPGTPIFSSLEHEGRILSQDWSKYDDIEGAVNYQPKLMSTEELLKGLDWTWRKFYSLPSIWRRLRRRRPNGRMFWMINLGIRYYSTPLGSKIAPVQSLFRLLLEKVRVR